MATLATLRTAIASKVGLDNSTAGDQPLIDTWINDGYNDFLKRTRCTSTSATVALSAGVMEYNFNSISSLSIMAVQQLYSTSVSVPYRLTTPQNIYRLRDPSTGVTSTTAQRFYATIGEDVLVTWPALTAATESVLLRYVAKPGTLSASADTLSAVPTEWHKAIEYYGLWQGGDYDDDKSSDFGEKYRQLYEKFVEDVQTQLAYDGSVRSEPPIYGPRKRGFKPPQQQDASY